MISRICGFGALAVFLALSSGPAGADIGSAGVPLFLDASVPSTGRGRASTAVFWDESPNHWANPSLVAYHRGVRFEWNVTQLVPDLTDDVFHRTRRWSFGAYGIGIVTAGRPLEDLGSQKLDYGTITATDASGTQIAQFDSYEEIDLFGVGVSVGDLLSRFAPGVGAGGSPLVRYGDVAVGFANKKLRSRLTPAIGDLQAGQGETTVNDWGVLARLTPIDTINYPSSSPSVGSALPVRLDVGFGYSVLNFNDANLQFAENAAPNPIARMPRWGWSVHAAADWPRPATDALRSSRRSWLAEFVRPLIRFGYASDRSKCEIAEFASESEEVREKGWEITIANIYTIRRGRVEDPSGDISGDTDGWSAGLRFGKYGGVRYDKATRPQATGLDRVTREGWAAFVDPVAIWEAWLRVRPGASD